MYGAIVGQAERSGSSVRGAEFQHIDWGNECQEYICRDSGGLFRYVDDARRQEKANARFQYCCAADC